MITRPFSVYTLNTKVVSIKIMRRKQVKGTLTQANFLNLSRKQNIKRYILASTIDNVDLCYMVLEGTNKLLYKFRDVP